MKWIHSLGIAFSMYSKIPVPKVRWTNEAMQYTFCFFPLVGVAEGALLWGMGMVLYGLRDRNRLPAIFVAIVLTILPLLVTGGIHMDGFLDTTDARTFLPRAGEKACHLERPAHRGVCLDRSWRLSFVERGCLVCGRSGRASGDGLRLCPFQDTKRSFGDALQRSKKGRTGGGFFINPPGNGQYAFPPYAILSGARVSYV